MNRAGTGISDKKQSSVDYNRINYLRRIHRLTGQVHNTITIRSTYKKIDFWEVSSILHIPIQEA